MIRHLSLFLSVVVLPVFVMAGIPKTKHPLEIPMPVQGRLMHSGNQLLDSDGNSHAWIETAGFFIPGTAIEVAEAYLKTTSNEVDFQNLIFHSIKETPGGIHVRFKQVIHGITVYDSRVVVTLDKKHHVRFVSNGTIDIPYDYFPVYEINQNTALDAAYAYLNNPSVIIPPKVEQVILKKDKIYSSFRIYLSGLENQIENWEIFVDGKTGEIIAARDFNLYGQGSVFDPDPIATNRTFYGEPGYTDDADADNDSLTSSLVVRDLGELDYQDGLYYLRNDYAQIIDGDAPFSGLFARPSDDFSCTRSDSLFEPVNIFYFINQSMRYINDTLGYDVWPLEYEGPPKYDPDGVQGAANCFYDRDYGVISFGSPPDAVDSGEDQTLILHELMHGIHDWISGNGISNNEGLSEGCCDYWAQSYVRSMNLFTPDDEQYDWFCLWGLKPYYGDHYMRVTNYNGHYPEDLVGEEHDDGQMWSSSLMTLFDLMGRDCSDRLLLETLSMLDGSATQQNAALAFFEADNMLYNGEHIEAILNVFYDRGYLTDIIYAGFTSDVQYGEPPLTVQFSEHSSSLNGPITSWAWDLDGDGEIDSNEPNPQYIYANLGSYDVTLTVSDGTHSTTTTKEKYISVNSGILVYNGNMEGVDFSGDYFSEYLSDRYDGAVYFTNVFPTNLEGYEAVFLSFGSFDANFGNGVLLYEEMILTMNSYLNGGGKIYIEGGQLFYMHYINQDYDVYSLAMDMFGIDHSVMEFGELSFLPISGGENSIFEDFSFEQTTQQYFWNMEVFPYLGSGIPLLVDSNSTIVAVQNENENDGRSICFSYSLSELTDNGTNTRDNLMEQVTSFFDLGITSATDDEVVPLKMFPLTVYPNPFNNHTRISFDLKQKGIINISIYNLLGQEVYSVPEKYLQPGQYSVIWSGKNSNGIDVASGTYLLKVDMQNENRENDVSLRKISLIK